MAQRGILWLTGVHPDLKVPGLSKKQNEDISKILFEGLITSLNEQISKQKNLERIGINYHTFSPSHDIAFTNGHQKFLIVGNKSFSDADLEYILSQDPDIFIIFISRPASSKYSIIEVAKRYDFPVMTQAIPKVDWAPESEQIERSIESEPERMDWTYLSESGNRNEMESKIMGFLNRDNSKEINRAILSRVKRWITSVMKPLIKILIECILNAGCQYLGSYFGLMH